MRRVALAILVATAVAASAVHAQRRYFGEGRIPPLFPPQSGVPTSGLSICRLMYDSVRYEAMGMGWRTDYPGAETNLLIRASELTKTRVAFDGPRRPNAYVVRPTDEALFSCPFLVASDVGTLSFSDVEASMLREYFLKGGFLWVDDFWGTAAWEQWAREIGKVFSLADFPIEDVDPEDPLYRAVFEVTQVPQVTNIQFWRQVGGSTTSERGADSDEVHLRAIRDQHDRIMVLMSHNTDIADSWEREGEDPEFFYQFSPDGYAFGMNVIVHVLGH